MLWPSDLGEVHKDALIAVLESEHGFVSRTDQSSSRHLFLKEKQSEMEWPFPLNRDGTHFAPLIVLRILERFGIPSGPVIELLQQRNKKQDSADAP